MIINYQVKDHIVSGIMEMNGLNIETMVRHCDIMITYMTIYPDIISLMS